jgi:hypothetical protein
LGSRVNIYINFCLQVHLKGIFQPFELGGETILIRSAVKH